MSPEKLNRLLKTIGKRCFENCYEIAFRKGGNLTTDDLLKYDRELKGTTETGLKTRLSTIKRIVREGYTDKAIKIAKNRAR